MHLDTYKEVAAAVASGRNVVCRVSGYTEAVMVGREVMSSSHHGWSRSQSNPFLLRCGIGIFHMVMHEREAVSMEYHDSIGWIGEFIASRVRLDQNNNETKEISHV